MNKLIQSYYPTHHYRGTLSAPASKSYAQRAIALAALALGESILVNLSNSKDVSAALQIAENFGATITPSINETSIIGTQQIKSQQLNAGEAGLSIRMFTPIAALFDKAIEITGEGSLMQRPLHVPEKQFAEHGVSIQSNGGYLPIQIKGPMQPGHFEIDGSQSSQVLTGLLMALPLLPGDSTIQVHLLKSKPYVDMTLDVMQQFGVNVSHENYTLFRIKGHQSYQPTRYEVEGDWSGAAFHLVGAAVTGDITVKGLNVNSSQADRAILHALTQAGAEVSWQDQQLQIRKKELNAFEFDATHCPDLFPPLSNLAAQCKGTSIIKGVSRLQHKESNRAVVMQEVWQTLGIEVQLQGDLMYITGSNITGGSVSSHNDHRIAMMAAIASLTAQSPITISEAQAIQKSYPDFYNDFETLSS